MFSAVIQTTLNFDVFIYLNFGMFENKFKLSYVFGYTEGLGIMIRNLVDLNTVFVIVKY